MKDSRLVTLSKYTSQATDMEPEARIGYFTFGNKSCIALRVGLGRISVTLLPHCRQHKQNTECWWPATSYLLGNKSLTTLDIHNDRLLKALVLSQL